MALCSSVASMIWEISFSTYSQSPPMTLPILTTISISVAPFLQASIVSITLISVVLPPCGNPITVQTPTAEPFSNLAACATADGFTQTVAVPYLMPILQASSRSLSVAVGCNTEWSMYFARSIIDQMYSQILCFSMI